MATKKQQKPNRRIPQSPENEIGLLGSLFFDPEQINAVADIVSPDDFYEPVNAIVAQVLWDFWQEDKPFDPALVYDEIIKRKQDAIVGGHEGLMRLADAVPESSHAVLYAKIVKDKSILRETITACQEIIVEALKQGDPEELIASAHLKLYDISDSMTSGNAVTLADAIKEAMVFIDKAPEKGLLTGMETHFTELDGLLIGLQKQDLIILAARPSRGKTSLAMNIAKRVALNDKKPVAFFSLETSIRRLVINLLCSHAKVNAHALTKGVLAKEDYMKLNMAAGALGEAPIIFDDTSVVTPDQLAARARRLKAQYGIELLIVDYLQLMKGKAENRQQEITEISRRLKLLAKDLDIPIIALSQLSRGPMARSDTRFRPRLADLRESGALEQDADVVILLYREDYYRKIYKWKKDGELEPMDNIAEIIVAKQRNGPTGVKKLLFFEEHLRFEDREWREGDIPEDHY